jgi:hypothetical protein
VALAPLGGKNKEYPKMIKSLVGAAILAIGLSSVAYADDAAPAAAKPMAKTAPHHKMAPKSTAPAKPMCYHTVKGKKQWHECAAKKM